MRNRTSGCFEPFELDYVIKSKLDLSPGGGPSLPTSSSRLSPWAPTYAASRIMLRAITSCWIWLVPS